MPYKLTWENSGVLRQYFGDVSIAERRASFDKICSDPRFDDLRYTITDYTAVQEYEVTTSATMEIAAMHIGPLFTNSRILITAVSNRPDITAAIHDFMALGIVAAPYRVFQSVDEARAWIASLDPSPSGRPLRS